MVSKKSQEKYKAAGLCILCGKCPPRPDRVSCESCCARQARNTKKSRNNKITNGKCCVCGKKYLVTKRHCKDCKYKHSESAKRNWAFLREEVYAAYGGFVCNCCGEKERAFLSIDHINDDGCNHRKEIGSQIYRWLKKNNFPKNFQVLCMNCQWGRKNCNGVCPHQIKKAVLNNLWST